MSKFKIGDTVICVDKYDYNSPIIGEKYNITGFDSRNFPHIYSIVTKNGTTCWMKEEWLKIVEDKIKPPKPEVTSEQTAKCTTYGYDYGFCGGAMTNVYVPDYFGKIKKETIMSKVKEYVKNLTLSADEKALRQVGFKDENGAFTSEAFDVIEEKLANDNIAYLVEIANGIISEEKK
jgi:hypothetical protein